MNGEHLDLTSDAGAEESPARRERRYLGVHFACCNVYTRVYVNRQESAYVGYCPKCSRRVQVRIGPGGSDSRFFTAY